jgi:hypothetical protein
MSRAAATVAIALWVFGTIDLHVLPMSILFHRLKKGLAEAIFDGSGGADETVANFLSRETREEEILFDGWVGFSNDGNPPIERLFGETDNFEFEAEVEELKIWMATRLYNLFDRVIFSVHLLLFIAASLVPFFVALAEQNRSGLVVGFSVGIGLYILSWIGFFIMMFRLRMHILEFERMFPPHRFGLWCSFFWDRRFVCIVGKVPDDGPVFPTPLIVPDHEPEYA